jgi:ferredoxin-NADP reductase
MTLKLISATQSHYSSSDPTTLTRDILEQSLTSITYEQMPRPISVQTILPRQSRTWSRVIRLDSGNYGNIAIMYSFTVKDTNFITPGTLLLTLKPRRSKDRLPFHPGQYAAIGFKRYGRPSPVRCFSIVSSPNHPEEVQFAMRVVGNFTQSIAALKAGTRVFIRGPFGNFVTDDARDRNIVLLAGGIGVTPFISMIRHATETGSTKTITLLYSCKSQNDIPFYQELLALERLNTRFRVYFFVTGGGVEKLHEARVLTGRIDETRLSQLTKGQYNHFKYFICGPKSFLKAIETTLVRNNTYSDRIVTEEFTPSSKLAATFVPKGSATRWTYGLSAVSLTFGTAFFMFLDLYQTVPKLVSAAAAPDAITQTAIPSATPNPQSTTGSAPTQTPASATTNSAASPPQSAPQAAIQTPAATPVATPQPTQSYQAPVTSVS